MDRAVVKMKHTVKRDWKSPFQGDTRLRDQEQSSQLSEEQHKIAFIYLSDRAYVSHK